MAHVPLYTGPESSYSHNSLEQKFGKCGDARAQLSVQVPLLLHIAFITNYTVVPGRTITIPIATRLCFVLA